MIINKEKAIEIAKQFAVRVRDEIDKNAIVYLFGSTSRDEAHEKSDIDIAVISSVFTDDVVNNRVSLMLIGYEIVENIEPHPILLSDWQKGYNFLSSEVRRDGITTWRL